MKYFSSILQRRKDRQPLLTQCREVATNKDTGLHQRGFERTFPFGQMLMAADHKLGYACRGKLDTEEIVQQLAGTCIGNGLTSNQLRRDGLNACSILCRGLHVGGKRSAGEMQAHWTLFLFHLMLHDPESFDRQVDDLPSLSDCRWTGTQILFPMNTTLHCIDADLVRALDLLQGMSLTAWLPARLLPTLLA